MPEQHPTTVFVGGGNMTTAIIRGAEDAGVLDPERVAVADPNEERWTSFRHGFPVAAGALDWLAERERHKGEGQIVLAVKPQSLPTVAREVAPMLTHLGERAVVSILAGVPSSAVRASLGGVPRVVRVMPNTPAAVGRGMTAIALGEAAAEGDALWAERLFAAIGEVVRVEEAMIDCFTGLAGSGPAYVFRVVEALAAAGEAMGFDHATAALIARQTVCGAAELLYRGPRTPADLRDAVTSKGGTTAAGLAALESGGIDGLFRAAAEAARDRGAELGRLARGEDARS